MGGNLDYKANIEVEGSVVVNGNYTNAVGLTAGKAMWGMGFYPSKNATMLAVGGNFSKAASAKNDAWVSGNARIGGSVNGLKIATKPALQAAGYGENEQLNWTYEGQNNPQIRANLGRTNALQVDMNGAGHVVDYNDYVNTTLKPLSTQLQQMTTTGTIDYFKADDKPGHYVLVADKYSPAYQVTIKNEGWIQFKGDGQNHPQVFTLDTNLLEAKRSQLGVLQWSLDFRNVGDSQPIIINVTGNPNLTWHTGWRIMVNGQDYTTSISRKDYTWSRYRSIASRIMWNLPNVSNMLLDKAHAIGEDGKDVYGRLLYDKGALFPGSILLPTGSMHDIADTNGRILVGKNLTMEVWEHHNAPWIGRPDTPQCFTIGGKTTATIG